ncbi:MAG: GC-type dockerin domain-anchored protein [Phycisphaerales bacterium]
MPSTIRCVASLVLCVFGASAFAQRFNATMLLPPVDEDDVRFGCSVGADGGAMIVGAFYADVGGNQNQGTAHIFRWNGSRWALETSLNPADAQAFDYFGKSVAISGDTALVAASSPLRGPLPVSVFVRTGMTWTQQAQLTAPSAESLLTCAISGDTAIVGAPVAGTAYIFVRSGTTWTQQARLVAEDGTAFARFGSLVAVSGDTAVVGLPYDAVGSPARSSQGSVYVFARSGTSWYQQATLTAADGAANDEFGISVSVAGDTVLVGAHKAEAGGYDRGAAYVFVRSGGAWTQQAKLTASDGMSVAMFGRSVSLDADSAFIGASYHDAGRGKAYIFEREGAVWTEAQRLLAADGEQGEQFGSCVALSGDVALVGVPRDQIGPNRNEGSAWVFSLSESLCPADFNQDGGVDSDDVIALLGAWDAGDAAADFNTDGGVDSEDVNAFFARWDWGC